LEGEGYLEGAGADGGLENCWKSFFKKRGKKCDGHRPPLQGESFGY
jgi:hypothetical protein